MSSNYGDEDDFMNSLLADMDESLLRTPVKPGPSTTRTLAKPVSRPDFSGYSNQRPKTVAKRELALPTSNTPKPKPSVEFTPSRVPIDQTVLTTQLSSRKPALINDDTGDFHLPLPEEQLPRRVTTKTPAPPRAAPPHSPETTTRAQVKWVERQENGLYPQIRVLAIDETTSEVLEVILKDDWESTRIRLGDIINVLGDFSELLQKVSISDSETPALIPTWTITISSAKNILVLHPDLLLPITAISNASVCPRKPLLGMMVPTPTFPPSLIPLPPSPETSEDKPAKGPGQDKSQEPLVWGNLLHEVVQDCLAAGTWSRASIISAINRVLRDPASLSQLFRVDRSLKEAEDELRQRAGGLEGFARRFIRGAVPPEQKPKEEVEITGLHTVEEEIWSVAWGLKGKIDAAVEAVAEDPPLKTATSGLGKSISTGSVPPPGPKLVSNAAARSKSSAGPGYTTGKSELTPSAFTKNRTKGVTKGLADAIKRGMAENSGATGTSWTMPFEIKTGRTVGGMEHRAQTMLYTLLIAERYGVQTPTGILYYTQKDEIIQVHPARNEIRGLMVGRNELAASIMYHRELKVSETSNPHTPATPPTQPPTQLELASSKDEIFLPPPIDENYQCSKCYVKDACVLYRAAVERMPPSTVPQLADKADHLTSSQKEFFAHWETLIALEEQDMVRFRKELWTMRAEEREKNGRCFARMVPGPGVKRDGKFVYEFTRAPGPKNSLEDLPEPVLDLTMSPSTPKKNPRSSPIIDLTSSPVPQYQMGDRLEYSFGSVDSLLNGHIIKGDAVTISIDPTLLAFARGYVLDISTRALTVAFDQELPLEGVAIRKHSKSKTGPAEFRIDKDDYSGGMAKLRSNLAALFYKPGDERRLRLVVDLVPPRFLAPDGDEKLPEIRAKVLNPNQRAAIELVLRAQDYALVLGMPGTGKTTMVVELIKELVRRGKSVLLTSYTHSAVDTILLKLLEVEFDVLRLGNVDKVHIEARKFALGAKEVPETLEALERQLLRPPVVATTCLSIDHPLFARRTFDYCIVDEASQITLPSCLGPLRFAEKFVLVGDHFQLPPLVKSKDAREGGMDISLFRRLSDTHPEAVIDLALQYRMNAEIMTLSNKLIYSDRLQCGSEKVATQALYLPHPSAGLAWHVSCGGGPNSQCWLNSLIDPTCKVRFVDTDDLPARNTIVGSLVQNEIEAQLVLQTIEALSKSGVKSAQIGVISPYRQQIKLLSHMLQEHSEVEILTADRSQGRDKDCIIISMVRSNEDGNIGDLLKDWRRLNVSFTRARSKLIIFGSRGTLKCDNLLKQFFDLVDEKGWYMCLPKDAHLMHDFSKTHGKRMPLGSSGDSELTDSTPVKRARVSSGILKGRPLLQDIIVIDDD
ncbi:DNA replication factor Dna2 [Rhizoctonia solani]|uniref:DNA replication ATP-dependent helicase/nuclease DNA2 n=1 Tax=Rhizoctonia solani TaxID=456999 RepID=A0A8H7HFU7_9AGAM|nr:DNA replication factor Dna2 [Rhizoctonia solani]